MGLMKATNLKSPIVIGASLGGIIGLLIGGIAIPAIGFAIAPAWKVSKRIWSERG